MEYDEHQKNRQNLRHHLGKYCVFLRHCAILGLTPRRLGKVLGEKSVVQEHFKGLSGNELVVRFGCRCFLPSTCPICQTFQGKDKGSHYHWFTERKQELKRWNMCSG